jgi:hypothetical protein
MGAVVASCVHGCVGGLAGGVVVSGYLSVSNICSYNRSYLRQIEGGQLAKNNKVENSTAATVKGYPATSDI